MRRVMRKPCADRFKIFFARLTNINNHLDFLPGLDESKDMDEVDINNILHHATHNGWANNYYL